jgi:hypothetical protein
MREVGKVLGDDLSRYENTLAGEHQYRTTLQTKQRWSCLMMSGGKAISLRFLLSLTDPACRSRLGTHALQRRGCMQTAKT